jgi:hypothetical protein|tara:strand:+ start:1975 stop:2334 length:360 start_codon:yes stop_codon:yes gene_type:complete
VSDKETPTHDPQTGERNSHYEELTGNSNPDFPSQQDIIEFNRKEYRKKEMVDHPDHYGGEDNPYEAIKVIEKWGLGFNLGNAVKYISRADKKGKRLEDLKKASWYINRQIKIIKNERKN